MGHSLYPSLPSTRSWNDVVEAIAGGKDARIVADLAADAAQNAFEAAKSDPDVLFAIDLLAHLPLAARSEGYLAGLRDLGLRLDTDPGVFDLTAALSGALDRRGRPHFTAPGSDVGEFARLAAVGAVDEAVRRRLPSLFEATPTDVRRALRQISSGPAFADLAMSFFARFAERTLEYYVSRALPDHQGAGKRFDSHEARRTFEAALGTHCRESTEIVRSFARDWYGRAVYQRQTIDEPATSAHFAAYAISKLLKEFGRRRDA